MQLRMATNISSRAINLVHQAISVWWVHPLENCLIPHIRAGDQNRIRSLALSWATWAANTGRIAVLDFRLQIGHWSRPDVPLTISVTGIRSNSSGPFTPLMILTFLNVNLKRPGFMKPGLASKILNFIFG